MTAEGMNRDKEQYEEPQCLRSGRSDGGIFCVRHFNSESLDVCEVVRRVDWGSACVVTLSKVPLYL